MIGIHSLRTKRPSTGVGFPHSLCFTNGSPGPLVVTSVSHVIQSLRKSQYFCVSCSCFLFYRSHGFQCQAPSKYMCCSWSWMCSETVMEGHARSQAMIPLTLVVIDQLRTRTKTQKLHAIQKLPMALPRRCCSRNIIHPWAPSILWMLYGAKFVSSYCRIASLRPITPNFAVFDEIWRVYWVSGMRKQWILLQMTVDRHLISWGWHPCVIFDKEIPIWQSCWLAKWVFSRFSWLGGKESLLLTERSDNHRCNQTSFSSP